MSVAEGFIPSQHPRNPSNGKFVTHHTRVLTTGRMVPVVRPASIPTRGSRTRIITSGRPGTGHGRRQRERIQAQRRRAVAVRGAEARRVSRQLRGRSTGKIKSGGRNFTKRGPKR